MSAQNQIVLDNPPVAQRGEGAAESSSIHLARRFPVTPEIQLPSWRYDVVKRSIDVLASGLLMAIFAVPGICIAIAVLLTSRGPVFYREQRIGRGGRPFRIWKFRSMHRDANKRAQLAEAHSEGKVLEWRMRKHLRDPRITPIGGVLRRWSLDELPQLINVFRGEMSLIGPRPVVASELSFYGDLLPFYFAATPGLSGLWQVSGRSHVDYDDRARLDARYVATWSLTSDFCILCRTFPAVLGRIGAH